LSDHEPSTEVASPGVDARRWVAFAVILSGIFVTMMDSSIVNVAIPTIRSTLHASFGQAELTVATYALALSAGMITGGRLGDIWGQRRVFMVAFAAFTLTSFVCGVEPHIEVLIAGRLLQGASAAMLSPQVFALVRMSFADGGERRKAFGAMGVAIGLANVAGLILGGVLVQADLFGLGWRMVFLVNLPIGLLAVPAAGGRGWWWAAARRGGENANDAGPAATGLPEPASVKSVGGYSLSALTSRSMRSSMLPVLGRSRLASRSLSSALGRPS